MLKLQSFGHLMRRTDSLEKDPDAGKDWRQKEKREAEMKFLNGITGSTDMNFSKLQELVKPAVVHGVAESNTI